MIFNIILISILVIFSFLGSLRNIKNKSSNGAVKTVIEKLKVQDSLFLEKKFDLDQNGETEKISIISTLGEGVGNENTKIYLNNSPEPFLNLNGYFDKIQTHIMNAQGIQILELRTIAGHSLETTFYIYKKGRLIIVPVSTAKPPYFYGIVSRNAPELKDLDGDGVLELLAYYRHFPPEKERTVEVYKFSGHDFTKTQKYEESMSELYL